MERDRVRSLLALRRGSDFCAASGLVFCLNGCAMMHEEAQSHYFCSSASMRGREAMPYLSKDMNL